MSVGEKLATQKIASRFSLKQQRCFAWPDSKNLQGDRVSVTPCKTERSLAAHILRAVV